VPLSRHSPLPELQAFVSLFRPRRVVPNTLIPGFHGLDWKAIDCMFAACLAKPPLPEELSGDVDLALSADDALAEMDTSLLNLVGGDGALGLAEKWAESGKLRKKIEIVRRWLGVRERRAVDRVLEPVSVGPVVASRLQRMMDSEDEDSNYGEADDERGRTAHLLFAGLAGIEDKPSEWCLPSSPSPTTPSSAGNTNNPGRAAFLTPVSSPLRFPLHTRPASQDKGKKRQIQSQSQTPPCSAAPQDKGKRRQIDSPATSQTPPAKRARVALGSPFDAQRQRYDVSAWLTISSPPSPLRAVGNLASSSKLPTPGSYGSSADGSLPCTPSMSGGESLSGRLPAMSVMRRPDGSLFPSRRITSPSGGVYTFYEVLPASSPAPQQSPPPAPPLRHTKSPASRARRTRTPPTLEAVTAERTRLNRRLKLHDRLRRDNPARAISRGFTAKRKKLENRQWVLKTKCDSMEMLRANQLERRAKELRRAPSFEPV
jgi:hypothetical protein